MTTAGVLDTSVVMALPALRTTQGLPQRAVTTTITLAELVVGPLVATDDDERRRRLAVLLQAQADLEALPFDAAAARAFGAVAADLRPAGRRPAARAYEALITAIAISSGLPVHTADPGDLAGISDLTVITVPLG